MFPVSIFFIIIIIPLSISSHSLECSPPIVLATASPCTQVRVDTAFLWIGWLVWSFIIGVLLWIGIREHRNGNRGVSKIIIFLIFFLITVG